LETNFMTGQSPSWRRHLYNRLSWKKASARVSTCLGASSRVRRRQRLGGGTQDGTTGLIWGDVRQRHLHAPNRKSSVATPIRTGQTAQARLELIQIGEIRVHRSG
jgi:hypothetical protein